MVYNPRAPADIPPLTRRRLDKKAGLNATNRYTPAYAEKTLSIYAGFRLHKYLVVQFAQNQTRSLLVVFNMLKNLSKGTNFAKKEQHLFNAVLNHVLDLIIDTVGGNSISFNSAILASFSLLINMSKSREKRQETLSLKVKYHILILEYSHIF